MLKATKTYCYIKEVRNYGKILFIQSIVEKADSAPAANSIDFYSSSVCFWLASPEFSNLLFSSLGSAKIPSFSSLS